MSSFYKLTSLCKTFNLFLNIYKNQFFLSILKFIKVLFCLPFDILSIDIFQQILISFKN